MSCQCKQRKAKKKKAKKSQLSQNFENIKYRAYSKPTGPLISFLEAHHLWGERSSGLNSNPTRCLAMFLNQPHY